MKCQISIHNAKHSNEKYCICSIARIKVGMVGEVVSPLRTPKYQKSLTCC